MKPSASTIHQLKVSIRGSQPLIWRRLEVRSDITLQALHDSIQAAFDWKNSHLWEFTTPAGGKYAGADAQDPEFDEGVLSAEQTRLSQVAPNSGDRLQYTYDPGDDWEHTIVVEAITASEPDVAYPRCLAGQGACPPEDCGGIEEYHHLIEVLADPTHPEHESDLRWLGLKSAVRFDPSAFEPDEVNTALATLDRRTA
ncbi:plasmid pRiA4b ORF-3 family protein [Kitasatospora sp. NPDC094028]